MSEIVSYGGFPRRYPHWRWGMEYEKMQKGYEAGMFRVYEIVINSCPTLIYILNSNTLLDNITVVAHATGHNDFFKNNVFFEKTNRDSVNFFANNGERIQKYVDRWGIEKVTEFIDNALRIETLIDPFKAWDVKEIKENLIIDKREYESPKRLNVDKDRLYMYPWLNTPEFCEEENNKVKKLEIAKELEIFPGNEKDIFGYIKDNANLKPWQSDVMSILYEEAMYLAPQRMTKCLNEGFACGTYDTLVVTDKGLIKLGEIVEKKLDIKVSDGKNLRQVSDYFTFERELIKITTGRGFSFEGSPTHKVLNTNKEWVMLKDWKVGEKFKCAFGTEIWAEDRIQLNWKFEKDIRKEVKEVDADLAKFFGYLNSRIGFFNVLNGSIGIFTKNKEIAQDFLYLIRKLFHPKLLINHKSNLHYNVRFISKELANKLLELGFIPKSTEKWPEMSNDNKSIPKCILHSPRDIVKSFIQGFFNANSFVPKSKDIFGEMNVYLPGVKFGQELMLILLNFGILSRLNKCTNICKLGIHGKSILMFDKKIGYSLPNKQKRLKENINNALSFNDFSEDSIESIEYLPKDKVYDISVEETHCYAAQGFINHNSYVDHEIMAKQGLVGLGQKSHDCGIIEYALHKTGVLGGKYSINPYKLGMSFLMDIRERWDKGQFGPEWENCKDYKKKDNWDLKLGLGKEKIFEVRKCYNDVTLILEFFNQEFCDKFEFYDWKKYPNGEYRIESRNAKEIKKKLLRKYVNGGLPDIRLEDPNHMNRGIMLLQHVWDGVPLYERYVKSVLTSIFYFWKQEIVLASRNKDGEEIIYICNGRNPEKDVISSKRSEYIN